MAYFSTMTTSEIATVLAWHDALNEQDFDTLVSLSSDDIEVGNADGAVQGHDALVEWAESAGITVEPGRMYVHDGVVVVEQQITWASDGTTVAAASAFRVVHDHVTSVFRHDDLPSALAATDLTQRDLTQ
jgi:ketosteroid isomerase-like protein